MIAHSAVQSFSRTPIHNAILFIDTPTMLDIAKAILLDTAKAIFLSRKLYLAIIASNENENNVRCDW